MNLTLPLDWLGEGGPEAALVISTRVRLARNLGSFRFPSRADAIDRERVLTEVHAAAEGFAGGPVACQRIDAARLAERTWLVERQLVSAELAGLRPGFAVGPAAALLATSRWGALCNEEDHLRIFAIVPGLALERAWQAAAQAERELGSRVSFAFHPTFGYLTACPTNVGTGLRASVLLHLPGLVTTGEAARVFHGLGQVGLTVRGFHGEDGQVQGNLFQVSNQVTLGRTERELVGLLDRLVGEVLGHEMRARTALQRGSGSLMDDRAWRAWGLLLHARRLDHQELLSLLGEVRLGVAIGVLPEVDWATLNRLMIETQPAHLALAAARELDDEELPHLRAAMVRQVLGKETRG